MRNIIAVILTVLSFGLFVPGITYPIFAVAVKGTVQSQLGSLDMDILQQQSSILQTVEQLWRDDRLLVAVLIFLFSVLVPVCKALLVLLAHFAPNELIERRAHGIANAIGKWSMADVYVVAIFLAYLSTRGDTQVKEQFINILGMRIPFRGEIAISSDLGPGFYFFLAYCLVSILSFQLYKPKMVSGV